MFKIKKNIAIFFIISLMMTVIAAFSISINCNAEEVDNSVYIFYHRNGGTGTPPEDTNKYSKGSKFTVLENNLEREGHTFGFWYEVYNSFDTGRTYDLGDNDVNLYAFWYKTITLDESSQTYTYNGISKDFVLTNVTDDLKDFIIKYAPHSDGEHAVDDWSETAPTDVGSYDVYIIRNRDDIRIENNTPGASKTIYSAKSEEDKTYDEFKEVIKNGLVINPKEVVIDWETKTYTYDGTSKTAPTATYKDINDTDVSLTVTNNTSTVFVNGGTYTFKVSFANGETNYCLPTVSTKDYIIDKVTLTPSINSVTSKVYDGLTTGTGIISLDGAVNNEEPTATATFTWKSAIAGETKVDVTNIALDSDWATNYKLSDTSLSDQTAPSSATINKKEVVIDWDNKSFVYNGSVQTIKATYKDINGEDIDLTVTIDKDFKEVGTYTATASFKNSEANYKLPETVTKEYEIVASKTIENKVITDENKKVVEGTKVELISGSLDNGCKMAIQKESVVQSETVIQNIKKEVNDKSELIMIFDIHIEDQEGIKVENITGNNYKVTLVLKEDLVGRTGYAVVYIKDNGDVEKYDATVTENKVIFETTHFSTWGIVADEIIVPSPSNNNPFPWWGILLIILGSLIIVFITFFFIWKVEYDKASKIEEDKDNRKLKFFDIVYLPINNLIFNKKKVE